VFSGVCDITIYQYSASLVEREEDAYFTLINVLLFAQDAL